MSVCLHRLTKAHADADALAGAKRDAESLKVDCHVFNAAEHLRHMPQTALQSRMLAP